MHMTRFPFDRPDAFAAPAEFAVFREREPVARVEMAELGPVWLVTGYDDVRRVRGSGSNRRARPARTTRCSRTRLDTTGCAGWSRRRSRPAM
jgi:hypothetical protein